MKALVFGVAGQDGQYLKWLLEECGVEVFGVSRSSGDAMFSAGDPTKVREVVAQFQPDYVFHLAATSSTDHRHLWANHETIAGGTLAVLEAVHQTCPKAKVFLAGSGLQFANEGQPLAEDSRLGHSSAYVVARNQSLFAARYYRTLGMKVYFGFLFHHDSPLRSSHHMSMKIAEAAALASTGNSGRLLLGDLDAEKEYTFAGDVVAAVWTFVRQDDIWECVIGSGRVYSIRQWAQGCFEHVGLDWANYLGVDPAYSNPCRRLVSNPAKLRSMGWQPKVQFGQLCEMMMQEALKRATSRDRC